MRFKVEFELGGKRQKKADLLDYEGRSFFLNSPSISATRLRSYAEAYRISEVVRSSIDKVNLAAKGIPWYLYRRTRKQNVEVESHPLVNLRRQPSKGYSWSKFIERALGFYLISGNRFMRKNVGSFRKYGEIEILASHKVQIKKNAVGEPVAYEYFRGLRWETIPLEEILHTKMFNPGDDLLGLSPISAVATQIDISTFAAEWTIKLLEKGARPGAVAFIPGALTDDQRDAIKKQWKEDFQGPDNVGGLLLLEAGGQGVRPGDLKLMSFSPKELELPGSEKTITRRVCSVYHVPPELLGDSENKTYSNQKEARKALYQEATLPLLDEFRDELNGWVVPAFDEGGDLFFDYDVSDIDALAIDTNEVWERFGKAVDRGILTRNQALESYGYGRSEEPGMDTPTAPATVLPISASDGGEGEE